MGFFALGFTIPAVLGALILLPVIWWLLRMIPPRPERIAFPPTRLLADIIKQEETPNRSPWWLTALRLLLAAALIIALSGPIWQPKISADTARGPFWLVIDNGWAAAPQWKERKALAASLIDTAAERNRPVALIATADGPAQPLTPTSANEARSRLQGLEPRGWKPDRVGLIPALQKAAANSAPGSIEWLSDDLDNGNSTEWGTALMAIAASAPVTVNVAGRDMPWVLLSTENGLKSLDATVYRIETGIGASGSLRALDQKGRVIGETPFVFSADGHTTTGKFELPTELRNDIARVEILNQGHAAGVQLLDERWRRRTVGLISGAISDTDQPLLSPAHYLEAALKPFADLRQPPGDDLNRSINDLVKANVSTIVTADVGTLVGETEKTLSGWVTKGGVLIRFAGPKLAAVKGGDKLVPVDLRQGGRTLGGALSWSKPQSLASFSPQGPFASLPVPKDVTVTRQVLAEQRPDLERKTWASLADGTPLVTAARLGNGWIVLFHVTADPGWSNLPLSGSFVEMLRRVIAFSLATGAKPDPTDVATADAVYLPPLHLLDGYGHFISPGPDAKPITDGPASVSPSREHPPGLYGSEGAFVALEPMAPTDTTAVLDLGPLKGASIQTYTFQQPLDLKPMIFALAVVFLILDTIAVLALSGGFRLRRAMVTAAIVAGLAVPLGAAGPSGPFVSSAFAQSTVKPAAPGVSPADKAARDRFDKEAALGTRLAYVMTGNAEIDDIAKRGLEGLTRLLGDRTALDAAAPVGIDPARDDLAFFPLIYWPIDPNASAPTPAALTRIDAFMKGGGTILFDTRDALQAPIATGSGRVSPATAALRRILAGLDIPELEPVPSDHVLTKTFYLLQDYPGRFEGGQLWVEATPPQAPGEAAERPVRSGDGVSPIIITSNDLAGAWALNDSGDFLLPTVPPESRQREMAFRVGVNIVMYTLTGNYKSDQVHVPALLERLGQ